MTGLRMPASHRTKKVVEEPKVTEVNGKKFRTMHLSSFFQTGLSHLEADERRRRLFEAEDERDRKIMEDIVRKQRELEEQALAAFAAHVNKAELERIQQEKQKLEEERKFLMLRVQDRNTNDVGKKVLTNLYVGGERAAANRNWLLQNNIKAVLNCTINLPNVFEDETNDEELSSSQQSASGSKDTTTEEEEKLNIEYKRLDLEDSTHEDISVYFEESAEWIHTQLNGATGVLVHCKEGRSRSCAIVLSYLMLKTRRTLTDAYKLLMQVRPLMSVNDGYMQHLKRLNMEIHGNSDFNVSLSSYLFEEGSSGSFTNNNNNSSSNSNGSDATGDASTNNNDNNNNNNNSNDDNASHTPTKKGSLSRQMRELEQNIAASPGTDGLRRSSRSSRSASTYDDTEGDFFAALEEPDDKSKKSNRKRVTTKKTAKARPTPTPANALLNSVKQMHLSNNNSSSNNSNDSNSNAQDKHVDDVDADKTENNSNSKNAGDSGEMNVDGEKVSKVAEKQDKSDEKASVPDMMIESPTKPKPSSSSPASTTTVASNDANDDDNNSINNDNNNDKNKDASNDVDDDDDTPATTTTTTPTAAAEKRKPAQSPPAKPSTPKKVKSKVAAQSNNLFSYFAKGPK